MFRIFNFLFSFFVYSSYRKKYKLPSCFRFNGSFIRIYGDGELNVGKRSYISYYSYLNLQKGTVLSMGDDVSIGHNVKIYTSGIDSEEFVCNGKKVQKLSQVTIGNNVLIGANSFICPGVSIGNNVMIGANSVVSSDIPEKSVAAGAPARVLKSYSD